ncbi:hypothetical protein [Actinacidiphila glaucinigra]|uniref:hypothetical protein n=1 Tax=Actinacidiphila glaucinigra TaxID=235986 RepID=UPI002E36C1C7|nr:hypothetical protein [Actinacidiphila glaucinigra]
MFTADDPGDLCSAVTRAQEAELLARLAAHGIPEAALAARGRRRRCGRAVNGPPAPVGM